MRLCVNPVVPTQPIVDHSLAVEFAGFDPHALEKTGRWKNAATRIAFTKALMGRSTRTLMAGWVRVPGKVLEG